VEGEPRPLSRQGVYVWRPTDEEVVVFSRSCTDLGCPVIWDGGSQCFFCPCHGGIFARDGRRMAGPPDRELYRYANRSAKACWKWMSIRFRRWRDGREGTVAGERMKAIVDWALDRFAVKPIEKSLMDRRVAKGAWYHGDGAALFLLFNVLLITGAFLALSYSPSLEGAYPSVRYITDHQTLGWFVRGLHYWSAGLMVVMLVFHLFRQILLGGYKSPREGTWLIGVLLFFAVIATSLLGYVLRWDERAIYGLRVALNLMYRVPWIGESLVLVVQGGPHIGSQTLPRIYAVHVIFVPLLLLALVGYHMYLVVVHGITGPTERARPVASSEEQRRLYKADADVRGTG
jgi:hypothetical protein